MYKNLSVTDSVFTKRKLEVSLTQVLDLSLGRHTTKCTLNSAIRLAES